MFHFRNMSEIREKNLYEFEYDTYKWKAFFLFLNSHAMLFLCNSRHFSRKLKNSNCTYQMLFIKIITIHFPYISSHFYYLSLSQYIEQCFSSFSILFQCTESLTYTICGDVKIRIKRNYSVNWRFSYIEYFLF